MDALDSPHCAQAQRTPADISPRDRPPSSLRVRVSEANAKTRSPTARDPCRQPCFQKNACPMWFPNPDCRARGGAELISDHILLG